MNSDKSSNFLKPIPGSAIILYLVELKKIFQNFVLRIFRTVIITEEKTYRKTEYEWKCKKTKGKFRKNARWKRSHCQGTYYGIPEISILVPEGGENCVLVYVYGSSSSKIFSHFSNFELLENYTFFVRMINLTCPEIGILL